ncbi:MAG: hypothetical protein KJ970_14575 [Candidatus Eisenbacteria bacterium]|uniref:Alginate export domain-containing protein n=1 Tax=Eiseniibacteriota bacterium TaxID=2212470 RepID=A0A948RYV2_UNCEI|nr:hypothetical protein [Candidatus Eisenbacteria bacterium]MBU1949467.1 hypothetical protein [Candidatus Eisenbacteria bacterium]MBU2692143.1 hypothetical protein [Candidatus Eisenbacteria bacterium]
MRYGAHRTVRYLFLFLLLHIPAIVEAQETTIQAHQELEIWNDSDLDEMVADERFDFRLGYGNFALSTTFLIHQPSDADRLDPNLYGDPFEGLRKRMLEARVGSAVAQIGHVYSTLARGVGLQIIENQPVDFDNAVDGFRARWDEERYQIELLAGGNAFDEKEIYVKAASFGTAALSDLHLSYHAVQVDSTDDPAGRPRGRDRIHGGDFEWSSMWGDLFAAYLVRDYIHPDENQREYPQGHAGYGVCNIFWGPLSLSFEGADFLRYKWAYSQGTPIPIRQHATTLLTRGSHVANFRLEDERGYQAEALLGLLDGVLAVTLNHSASETHDEELPFFESYGDLQWHPNPDLTITLRASESEETIQAANHETFFERLTYGGNIYQPVTDTWSVEIDFETQGVQEQNLSVSSYTFPIETRDNLATFNLYHAPNLAFAVTHEWTNDAREKKDEWTFAEMNFQFMERHQLSLGFGSFRGGQLCSGGICRPLAPFTGLRLNWQTVF